MKAIDLLKGLCSEAINFDGCFIFNGDLLHDGGYSRLFPMNRDCVLDLWFKKEYSYLCLYSTKDANYCFLPEPSLRAKSNMDDEDVIDFWIIEE